MVPRELLEAISPVFSVMSDSLRPHGLSPARLLCPWNFPGKNTGVGYHLLLQGIFLTQGSNLCLLHFLHRQADSLPLAPLDTSWRWIFLLGTFRQPMGIKAGSLPPPGESGHQVLFSFLGSFYMTLVLSPKRLNTAHHGYPVISVE